MEGHISRMQCVLSDVYNENRNLRGSDRRTYYTNPREMATSKGGGRNQVREGRVGRRIAAVRCT